MAAIRAAETSGNRSGLRAALDRASRAPGNSAKSAKLKRMVAYHAWARNCAGGGKNASVPPVLHVVMPDGTHCVAHRV